MKGTVNVPGVSAAELKKHTNEQTPTFTQASTLENISSGEKMSTIMGKIMKAIAELISHLINKRNPHNVTAEQVGADPRGTATSTVSGHNTNASAHNDIRILIEGLTTRLNALADCDDTTLDQMSEVVAYIKSNKTLIDAITTGKVSVTDIIDNLTTNVSNKPLSAAQGVALKALIDTLTSAVNGKAPASHGNHVPATQTADNATFLRNDNTWQKITAENIGAATMSQVKSAITEAFKDIDTILDEINGEVV